MHFSLPFAGLALLAAHSAASPLQHLNDNLPSASATALPSSTSSLTVREKRQITFFPSFPDATQNAEPPKHTSSNSPRPSSTYQPQPDRPSSRSSSRPTATPKPSPTTGSGSDDTRAACESAPTYKPVVPLPIAGTCAGFPANDDLDGVEYLDVKTVTGCADACWDAAHCESFAVSKDGQSCLIYSRSLSTMKQKTSSNYLFYDKWCLFEHGSADF